MKFTPKSENEIASENLLTPGVYGFEIIEASDEISKAGNEMIKLTVHVFDDGSPVTLYDYLMEKVAYKLRHAAEVCGLLDDYERGALDALDFQGKTGRCKVVIQKDKTGQFPDKNGIADYLKSETAAPTRAPGGGSRAKTPAGDIDDEVPFGPCWQ